MNCSRAVFVPLILPALLATLCIADAATPSVHASTVTLGAHRVGAPLSAVRDLKRLDNCYVSATYADCIFVDSSGVEYSVVEATVFAITARHNSAPSAQLPFGLKFGERLDIALSRLISDDQDLWWHAGTDHDGGIILVADKKFPGDGGAMFDLELRFRDRALIEVKLRAGETI